MHAPTVTRSCRGLLLGCVATLALTAVACSSSDDSGGAPQPPAPGEDAATEGNEPPDGAADATAEDGSEPYPGLIAAPVRRYDYSFDMATGKARSLLTVDVPAPGGNEYAVDCRSAAVESPTWNGAPADSHTLDGDVLTLFGKGLPGGATLAAGADVTVKPATAMGLQVGFSRRKNLAGGQFSYLLSWVEGCDRFGPCDHRPDSLVELHFDVTHAAGEVVLCPGTLTPGSTETRCDVTGTLAPTYAGFAIASDPLWKRNKLMTAAGVDVVFYEVPGGLLAQSLDTASFATFLDWITGLLGPMPFGPELRVAGGPTTWLGFEHPANIILHEKLSSLGVSYADAMMHVLVHETVHQWAGNRVTLASAQDFVWKEAIGEYLTYVFEDEHRPAEEAAASLAYWDAISLQAQYHPRPTDTPAPAVNVFYGDVYGPGPMVLFVQLETMLGRAVVLQGIQSFLADAGARTVDDLEQALELASGEDLSDYFQAWVFGSGAPEWPTLSASFSQTATDLTVTVTQTNGSGVIYPCAVEVQVDGATQSAKALVNFGLHPSSASASTTIPFTETATSHVIDPQNRLVSKELSTKSLQPAKPLKVWIL